MFKKALSVLISSAAIMQTAAFASFNDVNESSAGYEAISELDILSIVDGDENGNFNPYETVTRAEFTKMLVAAFKENNVAQSITKTRFNDCKEHWALGYIETGVADGFINGYDNYTFGPDDTITYAQAVKMLVAAMGYTVYADNSGGWPAGYMKYGNSLKITKGVSGASNDMSVTREMAAVLLDNTLDVPIAETSVGYNSTITIYDGRSGRDYETLLTDRHNAYRVKGRVTGTSRSTSGIPKGYVNYQVEVSDNFDGTAYSAKNAEVFQMKVGGSDMTSFLFIYTEALVQKDDVTGEYTILTMKAK